MKTTFPPLSRPVQHLAQAGSGGRHTDTPFGRIIVDDEGTTLRRSEIPEKMDVISASLSRVRDKVSLLEKNLDPILNTRLPQAMAAEPMRPMGTTLGGDLQAAIDGIRSIENDLDSILERIAL